MFRDMLRKKQQLSQEECIAILKNEPRGVLSVLGDDDYPYGMPMNHCYTRSPDCSATSLQMIRNISNMRFKPPVLAH